MADFAPPRRGSFGLTTSGLFTSAMITVATLPATSVARNTTIQIHGLSYSHFRMVFLRAGAQGPRNVTLMSCETPPVESVTVNEKGCESR